MRCENQDGARTLRRFLRTTAFKFLLRGIGGNGEGSRNVWCFVRAIGAATKALPSDLIFCLQIFADVGRAQIAIVEVSS